MSLIAWYPLNGDLKDYSGNNNDLIAYDGFDVSSEGKIGKCYSSTVASSYASSKNNIIIRGSHTYSLWVNLSSYSTSPTAIFTNHFYSSFANTGINLSSNKIGISIGYTDDTREWAGRNSTTTIELNKWYHVAMVHDANENSISVYVNGVLEHNSILTKDIKYIAKPIQLNRWSVDYTGYMATGKYNDVRVYDHALSKKEISEIFKTKVLHYKFDKMQEPTTNVVSEPLVFSSGWTPYTHGNDGEIITDLGTKGLNIIDKQSWCGAYKSITLPAPGIYTLSVYVKVKNITTSGVFANLYTTGGGLVDQTVAADNTKIGEWQRIQMTRTYTSTSLTLYLICYGGEQSSTNRISAEYTMPQIEQKTYMTDFVDGIRKGKADDYSGYNNHSLELTETNSPQWFKESKTGIGCYKFNGSNLIEHPNPFKGQNNLLQEWTVCAWVKIDPNCRVDAYLNSFNLGNKLIYNDTPLMYLNNGANDYYTYGNILPKNEWIHVAYVFKNSDGLKRIYCNGINYSTNGPNINSIPKGIADVITIGNNFSGIIDDYRIYATALDQEAINELYSSRAFIDKTGKLYASSFNDVGFYPTLVDYSAWTPGTMPSGWGLCGTSNENSMVAYTNPIGEKDTMWASLSNDADSNGDGGYDKLVSGIDNSKKYRVSVWVRRENTGTGRTYLGVGGNTVHRTTDRTLDANPYFIHPLNNEVPGGMDNRWLLFVGHIFPAGYTGGVDPQSGIWDPITNTKLLGNNMDFFWADNATNTTHRSYLYYSTSTTEKHYWYRPRIEICDGSEPSIASLLKCSEHKPLLNAEKQNISSKGIINCFNFSEVGVTKDLIAYYPLDSNLNDYSGKKNHLTGTYETVSGVKNQAIKTTNLLSVPKTTLSFGNLGTVSMWARHTDTSAKMLFSFNTDAVYGPDLYFAHDVISWNTGDGGSNPFKKNDINQGYPSANEWHHYAVVINATINKVSLYIDGEYCGDAIYKSAKQTNKNFVIGGNNTADTYLWKGDIDHVKLSSSCWSEKEIKIEYESTSKNKVLINKDGTIYANEFITI